MCSRPPRAPLCLTALALLFLLACTGPKPIEVDNDDPFARNSFRTDIPFADPEVIRLHEANLTHEYLIGSGDLLNVDIWNRPKLSGEHLVGPYGHITLPMLGEFKIGGMNRKKASELITALYRQFYEEPITTVKIIKYMNNRVYVLGRVANPGVIHFSSQATLLEALAMAGGLPTRDKTIFLSKCYIVRGKEQIIWIDLLKLLQRANLKLNISLANNDIIYIPESMDAAVFVMGEVENPGSYQIQTTGLSMLDAINLAGGPTEDAQTGKIRLIREMEDQEGVKTINMDKMLATGNLAQNFLLLDNDIIFIPKKGIASFNYYLRQIDPFMRTFISGTIIHESLKD
ncbi:polysaccharide biosynthesis/export family protein [Desulfoluna sp.]|uniref:SLBB domain-containing protein n=1 Tax=Desulfoluna sp. TaxID=2045199 RepID=UPI00262A93E1|nr:polysaccharide biosynthesis/export family protein [Desulfoluna sp.]